MYRLKSALYFIYPIIASILLFFLADFFIGKHLLPLLERIVLMQTHRIKHPVYHHDFAPNAKATDSWGTISYTLCTNTYGFKISCGEQAGSNSKEYDLAFIGDSFTEGIGLSFEDSFVGQIAQKLPTKKIGNLGVSSYAPSIYYSKLNYLLTNGFTFKEVVVYVDISDIQDDAEFYLLRGRRVLDRRVASEKHDLFDYDEESISLKSQLKNLFPLNYYIIARIRKGLVPYSEGIPVKPSLSERTGLYSSNFKRGAWTFDKSVAYGKFDRDSAIKISIENMQLLYELLSSHGIPLSVGVYPWPGQLLFDTVQSDHVKIWREFCKNRCKEFYNSYPSFFEYKQQYGNDNAIKNLFIQDDVHHSAFGASKLAEDFFVSYSK